MVLAQISKCVLFSPPLPLWRTSPTACPDSQRECGSHWARDCFRTNLWPDRWSFHPLELRISKPKANEWINLYGCSSAFSLPLLLWTWRLCLRLPRSGWSSDRNPTCIWRRSPVVLGIQGSNKETLMCHPQTTWLTFITLSKFYLEPSRFHAHCPDWCKCRRTWRPPNRSAFYTGYRRRPSEYAVFVQEI